MTTDVQPDDDVLSAIEIDTDALYAEMNRTGIGTLYGAVSPGFIARMREYIDGELRRRGGQYFGLDRADGVERTPLRPLIQHTGLRTTLRELYERAMGTAPPSDRVVPTLRVLAGTVGMRHANLYHYDSYVVTALVPLIIPHGAGEPHGDLVVYPNQRPVRRLVLANVIEKAVMESDLARRLWRMRRVQQALGAFPVPLAPGNIYFFWGMRSLHANEACLPSSVRSTALIHFGDPHEGSALKRISRSLHRRSLRRLQRSGNEERTGEPDAHQAASRCLSSASTLPFASPNSIRVLSL